MAMNEAGMDAHFEVLKSLIESCRDAQAGYLIAAEHARNAELRTFFTGHSMERARFASELDGVLRRMGGAGISRHTGIVDRINRAWLELKQKLGAGDAGVLENVEAFERNSVSAYRKALTATVPDELHALIARHSESISAAYDQVCALRDMGGKAA
jgi:uncharacterized protein (TIGR02284 family)